MPFLMKTILWGVFFAAMYFGGAGAQSSSNLFQGVGFFSIVVACVSLYIVTRLMWWRMSNLTRFALICGVLLYAAFSIGLFNGNTIKSFLSGAPRQNNQYDEQQVAIDIDELSIQMFGADSVETKAKTETNDNQSTETDKNNQQTKDKADTSGKEYYVPRIIVNSNKGSHSGLLSKVSSLFSLNEHSSSEDSANILNPLEYPEMRGHPKVVSGSILMLNNVQIKLFGVDAPDPTQTCANQYGNAYSCGMEAIIWMRNWLNKKDVSCRIISRIVDNRTTGICYSDGGKYDLAALVTLAGWAVAYTEHTQIYTVYEHEAALAHRGLWSGTFYKPWDWRVLQNRKVDIKFDTDGFNFKRWLKW